MLKFIPAAIAAISLAIPAPAFANRVGAAFDNSTTASRDGECYGTENGSKVCWFRVQGQTYSVAVYSPRLDDAPQPFLITCGGKWRAYGGWPKDHSQAFVDAFCNER